MRNLISKSLLTKLFLRLGIATVFIIVPSKILSQTISGVTPRIGAQDVADSAIVSGLFSGDRAIDPQRVKIFIDGQDVTSQSTVTSRLFTYHPRQPFSTGHHTVRVEYANTDDEWQVANWKFYVRPTASSLAITSVIHNAVRPINKDVTLLVTVKGTPNSQASVFLAEPGIERAAISATEVSAGVYVATIPVQASMDDAAVVASLSNGAEKVFDAAVQPVTLKSLTPVAMQPNDTIPQVTALPDKATLSATPSTNTLQPTFHGYADGDRFETRGFTLIGKTEPNARIDMQITMSMPLVGGLVNLGETKLLDRIFIADNNGNFEVRVPAPVIVSSGAQYQIRAVARQGSVTSNVTQLTLEQK